MFGIVNIESKMIEIVYKFFKCYEVETEVVEEDNTMWVSYSPATKKEVEVKKHEVLSYSSDRLELRYSVKIESCEKQGKTYAFETRIDKVGGALYVLGNIAKEYELANKRAMDSFMEAKA